MNEHVRADRAPEPELQAQARESGGADEAARAVIEVEVEVEVGDTGAGMDREVLVRIAKRGRVLVVDDDVMVGKALSRVLKDHHVTVLTDAREARDRLVGGERFDLILCDLMMPDMTGMELHAELGRTAPALLDRMVFVSGGAFTRAAMEFLDRVPNERIDKPFDLKSIRALAQRILR